MRTVQITIACTKEREREREREKLGTQVLIQPVTERKSFNVNRNIYMYKVNHSNNNYEKNATKKKRRSIYKHLPVSFSPIMKTKRVNI